MRKRLLSLTAVALVAALGLSACGSDDAKTTDVVDTTVASEAPSSEAVVTEPAAAGELKDIVDTAVAAGSFNTLAKLLTDAGLVETLKGEGPFTVFAPTDEAFAAVPADTLAALAADKALLTKVLTYHVVAGKVLAADVTTGDVPSVAGPALKVVVADGKVMINDATVTTADVLATNGVIHVIDKVLLPPTETSTPDTTVVAAAGAAAAGADTTLAAPAALADIVDTAVANGSFTVLAKLLTDAGLIETLKGEGPFTVFAPTDAAFAAVPAETLAALAADKALLTKVLTYHVVSGKVVAADVKTGDVPSVAGPALKVVVAGGKVMVNDATVTTADVMATNGVIHVIDKVLLPPA